MWSYYLFATVEIAWQTGRNIGDSLADRKKYLSQKGRGREISEPEGEVEGKFRSLKERWKVNFGA